MERPEVRLGYWPDTLARLEELAQGRAKQIADLIVQEIEIGPTPRDTGFLAESFEVVEDPAGDVLILAHARYWMFVEYGSRGKAGQHFLRHAINTVEAAFT
jgi:hypothetical protein